MNEETASNGSPTVSSAAPEDTSPETPQISDGPALSAAVSAESIELPEAPLQMTEAIQGSPSSPHLTSDAPEIEGAAGATEGPGNAEDTREWGSEPASPPAESSPGETVVPSINSLDSDTESAIPSAISWAAAAPLVAPTDETPPADPALPGASELGPRFGEVGEVDPPSVRQTSVRRTRPDWMMAFITGWAGLRSAWQVVDVLSRTDLIGRERILAFGGYGAIAAGLVLCCCESLLRGKISSRATRQTILGVLVLLLALGVGCLFLFKDPDPTRGRI